MNGVSNGDKQLSLTEENPKKVALITGITGQDGSYLAELLLDKGYEVHGIVRRSSSSNTTRIDHLISTELSTTPGRVTLHYGDLSDYASLEAAVRSVRPTEVYNLGAQSHVAVSQRIAEFTSDVNGIGVLRLLEAIRTCGLAHTTRLFQASTFDVYGNPKCFPLTHDSKPMPNSPYAIAKLFAQWTVVNYRNNHGMYACNGILFNHESPRRGENFVSRKITIAVARISLGLMEHVELGNLNSCKDWSHAKDFVKAMWKTLQQDEPCDYFLASGKEHTVRDVAQCAFHSLGMEIGWEGEGLNEVGKDMATGIVLVKVNPRFFRIEQTATDLTVDLSKTKSVLGYEPDYTFEKMIDEMVQNDLKTEKTKLLIAELERKTEM